LLPSQNSYFDNFECWEEAEDIAMDDFDGYGNSHNAIKDADSMRRDMDMDEFIPAIAYASSYATTLNGKDIESYLPSLG